MKLDPSSRVNKTTGKNNKDPCPSDIVLEPYQKRRSAMRCRVAVYVPNQAGRSSQRDYQHIQTKSHRAHIQPETVSDPSIGISITVRTLFRQASNQIPFRRNKITWSKNKVTIKISGVAKALINCRLTIESHHTYHGHGSKPSMT